MLRLRLACQKLSDPDCSERRAACHQRCSGPSAKPLSGGYLSLAEREEIALLNVQGHSLREIGRRLGRAASTISRELDRNAATHGGGFAYRGDDAQWHADRSARRPKPTKLALNIALRTYVEDRLAGVVAAPGGARVRGRAVRWKDRRSGPCKDRRWTKAWSPEQIARRLPDRFPGRREDAHQSRSDLSSSLRSGPWSAGP